MDSQNKTIELYTVQMSQWRLVKKRNIKFADITFKSGIFYFAPDARNVMAYKTGTMSEEEYTKEYLAKMEYSLKLYPKAWGHLKTHPKIAFACYCKPGAFCHRLLFTELVKNYLQQNNYTVVVRGEILPDDEVK
jgi:hypothetical protein